jgi:hypothetical protein
VGPINEQILRLMQSLGIDPVRTKEVLIFFTFQLKCSVSEFLVAETWGYTLGFNLVES